MIFSLLMGMAVIATGSTVTERACELTGNTPAYANLCDPVQPNCEASVTANSFCNSEDRVEMDGWLTGKNFNITTPWDDRLEKDCMAACEAYSQFYGRSGCCEFTGYRCDWHKYGNKIQKDSSEDAVTKYCIAESNDYLADGGNGKNYCPGCAPECFDYTNDFTASDDGFPCTKGRGCLVIPSTGRQQCLKMEFMNTPQEQRRECTMKHTNGTRTAYYCEPNYDIAKEYYEHADRPLSVSFMEYYRTSAATGLLFHFAVAIALVTSAL